MKKIFLICLSLTGLFITRNLAQNLPVKVGVINNLDTMLVHYYSTRSEAEPDLRMEYPFNLGQFVFSEISRVFDTLNSRLNTSYEVINIKMPDKVKPKIGYFNLMGKPKKNICNWLKEIYTSDSVLYVLILDSELPQPGSVNAFLTGNDYGLATYDYLSNLITYYTLVDYILFDTRKYRKVHFDFPTDLAMDIKVLDFKIEKELPPDDKINIPLNHLQYAIENIKEMARVKTEKILRTIVFETSVKNAVDQ